MSQQAGDFLSYMDEVQEMEARKEQMRKMLLEHEEWRQNTWNGWIVRQLQALGHHFAPFFESVADAMSGSAGNDPKSFALLLLIRILTVAAYVVSLYAVAKILSMCMGQEIIIEEEIVIDDDDDDNDDENNNNNDAKTQQESTNTTKIRRDKKKHQ